MTRSATPRGAVASGSPSSTRASQVARDPVSHTPLQALSAATRTHRDLAPRPRSPHRALSILFSCLVAVAAGTAFVLAGGFKYRCTALVQILNDSDAESCEVYRRRFTDHASRFFERQGAETPATSWVEAPAPDLLRLNIFTPDRDAGIAQARSIAEAFIASVDVAAQPPSERERWLENRLTELRERLDEAEGRVIESIAKTPSFNPENRRSELIDNWRQRRERFELATTHLHQASTALEKLRHTPVPTRAPVPAEVRRAALQANVALQQDLAHLAGELADLKLALLDVWREASPLAHSLATATRNIRDVIDAALTRSAQPAVQATVERVQTEAESYANRLESFNQEWTKRFATLEQLQPDPLSTEVFAVLDKIESVQEDFFFHAEKPLAAIQRQIRTVSDGGPDDARHHVIASDLLRAFAVLRQDHDRLSLTVAKKRPVRVEASLKTSRALYRRTRQAVQRIDQRLAQEALEQASRDRLAAIDRAQRQLEDAQDEHDRGAHELIQLQDKLNVTSDLTAEFLRAGLRAEFASLELRSVVNRLDKTQRELSALTSSRESDTGQTELRLRRVVAGDTPSNLVERLKLGGLGAIITFVVSLLSQWRLLRRRNGE